MSIELSNTTISKLYNKEKKFTYLKYAELAIITKEKYATKLLIVTELEELLEKDLYDFDEKDILSCFIAVADKNSINSLAHYSQFVESM